LNEDRVVTVARSALGDAAAPVLGHRGAAMTATPVAASVAPGHAAHTVASTGAGLFQPLEFAGLRLPNRLVMAPMGSCQSDAAGYVTDQTVAYYRRRARGGVGMITVESALVSPDSHGHEPRLHSAEFVPGMRRVVEAIRETDRTTVVGLQLMHPGRQVTSGPAVSPSPVPLNPAATVPHALTAEEIEIVAGQYARAARYAQDAGFQFVEVHGAHGYLPSDFLSPLINQRTDGYGGDLARRARFVLEVARAIIDATGIPLFWRLSAEELRPGGYSVEDQVQVARWLEAAGVACLSISSGTWHTLAATIAPMSAPRGHMISYASRIRAEVGVPVIAVGRLDDPALARQVLADGAADLVMLGRGLLADPDWPRKVRENRLDEVRPCIACNACVDLVAQGRDLRCAVNPETGREATWKVRPASRPRRIMVVGGGPAGMEAARIARLRGHSVSIWEREGRLGGKLDVASRAPSKTEVLRFRDFASHALARLGVDVHLDSEVTAELVERVDPDVVVVANGAEPLVPPIPGVEASHVVDAQDVLRGQIAVDPAEPVVVVGGSATGCETAEELVARGVRVTIVEMLGSIGHGIEQISRRELLRTLRKAGVRVITRATVTAIALDSVCYETEDGEKHEVDAGLVALAVGWWPRGEQLAELLQGREVVVVGDAERPADFVAATGAGAEAALRL
jgi:2,4-dienoyl-CoA reductase-like NADH-dependent reductase (Old Yellow Enzyme family)/NADH dehydrogenase FAD-containing subunit